MGITLRKTGVACGTLFASAAVALSTATAGHAANQALVIGGISTPSMSDVIMAPLLGGTFKNQQRVSINWPAQAGPMTGKNHLTLGQSINVGKTNLTTQINSSLGQLKAGEKVTVVGLSAGSLVVNEVLRDLASSATAPGKDKITFVVVADSSRQNIIDDNAKYNKKFDYTYRPAPETKYDVIVITGEYDGMADFPDRWWNTLAVTNAIAGALYQHVPVMYADLSKVPAKNIDVDVNSLGGKTTHYLVPAEKLPLVRMFPSLASKEAELKAKIDAAYIRNDAPKAAPKSLVSAAPVALTAPTARVATLAAPVTAAAAPVVVAAPAAEATTKATNARVVSGSPAEVPSTAVASLRVAAEDEVKVDDKADDKADEAAVAESAEAAAEADAAAEAEAADSDTSAVSSSNGDDEDGGESDDAGSTESDSSNDSGTSAGSSE
ncbi:PE-PPE domain-containing protein [Mycobacterium sp. 236(2023)]|uniref:PE-PPE domain-containing protein n=1 Tax=Mycobacterium sp. 236(2023) TaxID=3038163 RepID=UPI00241510E0|nr:PE-PPE domain-containing protein [Mycobacterium sp. 236(2023)]MDG4664443.1 PE-PPE domain-containing protein [Mycobacterium sp. 236(2023)]